MKFRCFQTEFRQNLDRIQKKFRRNLEEIKKKLEQTLKKKLDKIQMYAKKFRQFQTKFRQNLDIIQINLDIKIQTKFRHPLKNLDKFSMCSKFF